MKRALKVSSQYPFDVFCLEPVKGWLITDSDRKRHFASRVWIQNGQVLPERPVDMPLKVTLYRMSSDYDNAYPRWNKSSESRSLYAQVFYAQHRNDMLLIKAQRPDGRVDALYFYGKKQTTVEEIQAWKAARRAHIDKVNASWYPKGYWYITDMPRLTQFDAYNVEGKTAKDFWAAQRLIIRDIDIHVEHAKLSDKDRIDLLMYRKVLQTFLDRLTN